jgi:DNA-binding MurR/RpiR family transcriptional regulator
MPRPSSYDALKDAISTAYPRLSNQLQQIARFALDQPNELALGTVAAVAQAAGVQPSALIRFANALDFGGFSEMQQVFRARLLERSGSYRERIDQLRRTGRAPAPGAGVLHQFVGEAVDELSHLESNVSGADLAAAAALICRAARVHVLAQRRAFPVACYLAYALGQLDLKTNLLDGVGGMLADTLRHVDAADVLLVASFQNYSPEVIDAARQAFGQGVPVIAITDTALSPLKPAATLCFELGLGPNPAFRSLVTPLCLAQALVVSTGQRLTEPEAGTRRVAAKPRRLAAARAEPRRAVAAGARR